MRALIFGWSIPIIFAARAQRVLDVRGLRF
jgi:hypothetical protein